MIYASKKPGESNERLISRFKQVMQRSRVIIKAKQDRLSPKLSRRKARNAALIRENHRAEKAKAKQYA
jgi:ribosomal protein S21